MASGRFDKAADPLFREINDSLGFDYRLLKQDVEGSIAWAAALARAEVLNEAERATLTSALKDLAHLAGGDQRARDLLVVRGADFLQRV